MSNTSSNFEMAGVLLGKEVRKRKTPQEKITIIQQTMEKKQYQEGSLTAVAAGEDVVPASELAAAIKQINQLQRLLGKKTMEVELLKEAVEYAQSRKWIAHVPLLPSDKE